MNRKPSELSEKKLSLEPEKTHYLHEFKLDKISQFAYGLEGLANVTKSDEHKNIGYTLDIIWNAILELWKEIEEQKLEGRGGTK